MRYIALGLLLVLHHLVFSQRGVIIGYGKKGEPPFEVSGTVYSGATGEKLEGANILIERQNVGTSTGPEGKFSLTLYEGFYTLRVSVIGYETLLKNINVRGPGSINFPLKENIIELDEVVFQSKEADYNVTSKEIGKDVLEIESIKTLPTLGGEVNVLRSLTLLPGVSVQGEASSGINVRGGGIDQNLVLLGGATLYNPYHLFGFFSGFNSSVVRDVALHKGTIPANYGGRASSVVDVSYKKGNFGQWEGDITLGTAASKFSARGPVIKERLSVMTAGRIAYPNWLLRQTDDPNIANSTASFFDTNLVLNYIISETNNLEYSFYLSGDAFQFADNIENRWRNLAHVFRWNTNLNNWLFMQVNATHSQYTSNLIDDTPFNEFDLETTIEHTEFGVDFTLTPDKRQTIKTGIQAKFLENKLGTLTPGSGSAIQPDAIDPENAIESGIYFQHDIDIAKFGISYGVRYSDFRNRGPGSVNEYDPTQSRDLDGVIGTRDFGSEDIQMYNGIEPRAALKYQLTPTSSVKGGFSQAYQYIHLVTNTTSVSPTDTWKLSDPFLEPQVVTQYSLGFFKNFRGNRVETSIQGFYKDLDNLVEYRDGADLFLNPNLETELVSGTGEAYGVELYLKKTRGRFYGWLSYTFSRSLRQVESEFENEQINGGSFFPSNFDTPHIVNAVANYRLGKNVIASGIFSYSTGRPFTLPQGKFLYDGVDLAFFNERNNIRGPDIHRLDLSIQFSFPSKRKLWSGDWTLAIYNVYGRNNAFSVFFQDFPGQTPGAYQLSIIGAPFPSLSYEIKL